MTGAVPLAAGEPWWTPVEADVWADLLVAALRLGGVEELFFVSGSELTFLQEAIAKARQRRSPTPRLITMLHEHVALNAAIGAAMVRGAPSATAAHVDAGTLHHGAAIHTAARGGHPVLMMAGSGPHAYPGTMAGARSSGIHWVQEPRDQAGIVRQYTKADHRLDHRDHPGLVVSRLLQLSLSQPSGPTYLTIPQETALLGIGGPASVPSVDAMGTTRDVWPDPADVATIAQWLVDAERPLISTTRLGRDPRAVTALAALVDELAVGVQELPFADRLNLPPSHWAFGTGPTPAEADVLLVLDEVAPYLPGQDSPRPDCRIAWVSPDPMVSRVPLLEFRADLWIPAPPVTVLRAVLEEARGLLTPAARTRIHRRRDALRRCHRQREEAEAKRLHREASAGRLTGRVVTAELGRRLGEDAIVLNDCISQGTLVRQHARRTQPMTYFRSGGTAGGWGAGAAVGVKLARPDQDVVLVTGDGYLMFGVPTAALWASGYHHAPFLTVVMVNGSYSTGTVALERHHPNGHAVAFGDYTGGTFEPPPDFAALAAAAHGHGEHVDEIAQLSPALDRAFHHIRDGTPALVSVRIPR